MHTEMGLMGKKPKPPPPVMFYKSYDLGAQPTNYKSLQVVNVCLYVGGCTCVCVWGGGECLFISPKDEMSRGLHQA